MKQHSASGIQHSREEKTKSTDWFSAREMLAGEFMDRRLPVTILFALFLQIATIVWWAASKDSAEHFADQRVTSLEKQMGDAKNAQEQILERLARIEEKVNSNLFMLEKMDKRLDGRLDQQPKQARD